VQVGYVSGDECLDHVFSDPDTAYSIPPVCLNAIPTIMVYSSSTMNIDGTGLPSSFSFRHVRDSVVRFTGFSDYYDQNLTRYYDQKPEYPYFQEHIAPGASTKSGAVKGTSG
jgi:hypothetical protein